MGAVEDLRLKLARVEVKPHVKYINGKLVKVKGYTRGPGQISLFPDLPADPPHGSLVPGHADAPQWRRLDLDRMLPDSLMKAIKREGIPVRATVYKDAYFKGLYPGHYEMGMNARALVDTEDPSKDEIKIDIREGKLSYPLLVGALLHELGHTIQNRRGDRPLPASSYRGTPAIVDYEADAWDVAGGLAGLLGIEVNDTMRSDAERALGTYKKSLAALRLPKKDEQKKSLRKKVLDSIASLEGLPQEARLDKISEVDDLLMAYTSHDLTDREKREVIKAMGKASGQRKFIPAVENLRMKMHKPALAPLKILKPPTTPTDDIELDPVWLRQTGKDLKRVEVKYTGRKIGETGTGDVYTHSLEATGIDNRGNERNVGYLEWFAAPKDATISWVRTNPPFARQGVATALFQRAKIVTPHLKHGNIVSDQALAWDYAMDEAGIDSPNEGPQANAEDIKRIKAEDALSRITRGRIDALALLPQPKSFDTPIEIDMASLLPSSDAESRRKDGLPDKYVAKVRHVKQVDESTGYVRHSLIAEMDRDVMGKEWFVSPRDKGEVGRIEWIEPSYRSGRKPRTRFPYVTWVETKHQFTGKGVATALWQRAMMLEPKLHHSSDLTMYGENWIKSMRGAGLKTPKVRNA